MILYHALVENGISKLRGKKLKSSVNFVDSSFAKGAYLALFSKEGAAAAVGDLYKRLIYNRQKIKNFFEKKGLTKTVLGV